MREKDGERRRMERDVEKKERDEERGRKRDTEKKRKIDSEKKKREGR